MLCNGNRIIRKLCKTYAVALTQLTPERIYYIIANGEFNLGTRAMNVLYSKCIQLILIQNQKPQFLAEHNRKHQRLDYFSSSAKDTECQEPKYLKMCMSLTDVSIVSSSFICAKHLFLGAG